jgi:hypothetical protein
MEQYKVTERSKPGGVGDILPKKKAIRRPTLRTWSLLARLSAVVVCLRMPLLPHRRSWSPSLTVIFIEMLRKNVQKLKWTVKDVSACVIEPFDGEFTTSVIVYKALNKL